MDPQPFLAVEPETRQRERSLELLALDVIDHVLVEGAQHGVRRDLGDPAVQLPVAVAALGRVVPRRRQLGHQRVQVLKVAGGAVQRRVADNRLVQRVEHADHVARGRAIVAQRQHRLGQPDQRRRVRHERPAAGARPHVDDAAGTQYPQRLAEALEAPVLVSENARGAIDARHRLAFDGLALRAFRTDADLVLGVGTRFMTTFGRQIDVGRAALVLLNADPADLGEPRAAELAIHADAGLGLRALAAAVGRPHRGSREDEFEQVRKWLEDCFADITPQRGYLAAIRSVLPDDGVFVSEFTQVGYAASVCFPVYHPRGYIGPGYQGTLGYGFATALGAKAADPSRAVISVTGDGGFSWTMQELSTLRRYGLGLVTIVFNDGHFGNVRRI